jgi:hypothetical protein
VCPSPILSTRWTWDPQALYAVTVLPLQARMAMIKGRDAFGIDKEVQKEGVILLPLSVTAIVIAELVDQGHLAPHTWTFVIIALELSKTALIFIFMYAAPSCCKC